MRFLLALIAGCCALASMAGVAASPAALVLGFEGASEPRLTSLSTAARIADERSISQPHWTITANDADDARLWSRALPAPRQFHADTAVTFTVVVPYPPPGTRLALLDEAGRERWEGVIDQATLDVAERTGAEVDARRAGAMAATAALLSHVVDPTPRKRLEPARAERGSQVGANEPQRAARALPGRDVPMNSMPSETTAAPPASMPFPAPVETAAATVAGRVVDENGRAPGVAFGGQLLNESGSWQQEVQVGSNGAFSLSLQTGTSYQLDLAPPSPLVRSVSGFTYTGAPLADFVVNHGWLVDITLKDAASGSVIAAPAVMASISGSRDYVTRSGGGHVRASVPQGGAENFQLILMDLPGFAPYITYPIGRINADFQADAQLAPAGNRPVRVVLDNSARLPVPAQVYCGSAWMPGAPEYDAWADMDSDSSGSLRLPAGPLYTCSVSMTPGYFRKSLSGVRLSSSTTTLSVPPTDTVRFDLVGEDGRPYAGDVQGSWSDPDISASANCSGNPCTLRLATGRAASVRFDFWSDEFPSVTIGPEVFPANGRRTVVVKRQYRLSGKVVIPLDTSSYPRIRAFDAATDRFVLSTRPNWIGEYELPLASGKYVLEVDSNNDDGRQGIFYYIQPYRTGPITVNASQTVPDIVLEPVRGDLVVFATGPCSLFGGTSGIRAAARLTASNGSRVSRTVYRDWSAAPPSLPAGQCANGYRLPLSPGSYDIDIAPAGWPMHRLRGIHIDAGVQTTRVEAFESADRTQVWRTRILGDDRHPLPRASVILYAEAQESVDSDDAARDGSIAIPWHPGWSAELWAPDAGTSVRRLIRFGTDPLPPEVVLDSLDLAPVDEGGMLRIHGDGDRKNRFNLLFIAEGFVAQKETFTDTNHNGTWDGVIWYDIDGDGVYSQGDLLQVFGSARWPEYGTVPTRNNEPFSDLNGDGIPNLDDPALFVENARAFLRSLFGSDFWSEHRDAFNAYLLFHPSVQAGFRVERADGSVAVERSTRYGATLELRRGTLQLDRNAAMNDAIAALPEVDLAVIVVNDVFQAGRSNVTIGLPSSMIYSGGPFATSPNDMTATHEMGHAIGTLCDEYEEFGGVSPQNGDASSWCGNVGYSPAHVPWLSWLGSGFVPPSRHIDGSTGIFEGANYYPGGAYRPSLRSTMRGLAPYFNGPSRAALQKAVQDRTGTPSTTPPRLRRPPLTLPSRIRKPNPL